MDRNLPITRENWIRSNYGGDVPEPWTWEHERDLPEELRDHEEMQARATAEYHGEPYEPEEAQQGGEPVSVQLEDFTKPAPRSHGP